MDYSRLVIRAWEITWRYKYLWVFGLILAFFGGGFSPNINFNYTFGPSGTTTPGPTPQWVQNLAAWVTNVGPEAVFSTVLVILGTLFFLAILFFIVSVFLRAVARGALNGSVDSIEKGEAADFRKASSIGWKKLFPLIGIDIVINWTSGFLAFLIFGSVILWMLWPILPLVLEAIRGQQPSEGIVAILIGTVVSGLALLFCLVLIFIPISITIGLLFVLATNVCVIEQRGVFASIASAWGLFKRNLGPVLLIWLIQLVITLVVGFVLAIPSLIVYGLLFFSAVATQFNLSVVIIAVFIGLLFGLFLLVLNGILRAYNSVLWTLTYLEIVKKGLASNASSPSNGTA